MTSTKPLDYAAMLAAEAEIWDRAAEQLAALVPPDWDHHQRLRSNAVAHKADIDQLLLMIRPDMRVLDLGCHSGWLTTAMARRGARAHGIDIANGAIHMAQAYLETVRPTVAGEATYEVADLNLIDLPPAEFDLVVARGVFHHLIDVDRLISQIFSCLKEGGLLWVSDPRGHVAPEAALLAGLALLVMPSRVSYREKFGGLLRFGFRAPARVRASMEAEGGTPFEGIGRETDWIDLVRRRFVIERIQAHPAIVGYLADEIDLPDWIAMPILRAIRRMDASMVRAGILRSCGRTVYARKPEPSPSP